MKKRNFRYKRLAIIGLVLFMGIGFAYLSSQLTITGRGHVKKTTWQIYFDNINILKGESLASQLPTTVGRTTTELSYSVDFNVPGDTFQFNVDVVNTGTIDAMISLVDNTVLTQAQAKIAEYSITYSDGTAIEEKNFLGASKRDTFTVTIAYKKDISASDLPGEMEPINFALSLQYVQAKDADTRENSNLIVKDLSGNGYDGEFIGGIALNNDGSATFDGETGYIDTKLSRYNFGNNMSVVVRFKLESLSENKATIFGDRDLLWDYGTGIQVLSDGKLKASVMDSNWNLKTYTTEEALELDTWYTVTITYSNVDANAEEGITEDKNMVVYLNGTELTKISTENAMGQSYEAYCIGAIAEYDRLQAAANITISDFLLFERTLPSSEVTTNYIGESKLAPEDTSDLVIYYDFR